MSARRPLPEALDRAIGLDPGENLGLWLDRFLERDGADWSLTGEQRREALGRYARRWSRPAAAAALARRLDGVRVWAGDGPPPPGAGPVLRRFEARLAGRMVPGMSSGTPTELGLSLDRLYGAPRLPGSGLRGLARAWAETEGSGWWEPDGSCPRLEAAFGWGPKERGPDDPGEAGAVQFLDALPVGGAFELVLDVLTPHMGPWYRGEVDAPVDWLAPVPTTFLAVTQTRFAFDLLWWPRRGQDPDKAAALLRDAEAALRRGLATLGTGAKTASGYGTFAVEGG